MIRLLSRLAALALFASLPPALSAAPSVVADFNDCNTGIMRSGYQPAGTGIGFSAPYWEGGTAAVQVVAGDLTAPTATRYVATQTAPARSAQARGVSSTTRRQQYREIEQPLVGTVWGSFLVQQIDAATHNTGLTFNIAHIDPLNRVNGQGRLYAAGSALLVHGSGSAAPTLVPGQFVTGQTALVLFRYVSETRQLTVWVNPVLPDTPADLAALTPAFDGLCDLPGVGGNITTLGIGGYPDTSTSTNCGLIDGVRLSDQPSGYYDVTGLPVVPTIVAQPLDRTVARGTVVVLSVTASGQGELTYQWQKNGADLSGATGSQLALAEVQAADAAGYRVQVRDPQTGGAVWSRTATLTVLESIVPVTITAQPQPLSLTAGQDAALSVTATGTAPLTYQWQRNGVDLAGATSAQLTFVAVHPAQAGQYRVIVTNPAGSVVSAAVAVAVDVAPELIAAPQSTESYVGGAATFYVEARGTALHYEWRRGTEPVGGDAPQLTLTALQPGDAGSYTVTVRNALGSITTPAATLTLVAETPAPAGSVGAVADSFVENGTQAAQPRNGLGLRVAARGTVAATYKTYVDFALPLAVKARDAGTAAVRFTLDPVEPVFSGADTPAAALLPSAAAMRIRFGSTSNSQTYLSAGPTTAGADIYRGLLTFDLSSLAFVPDTMSLRLTVAAKASGAVAGGRTLRLHRVTRPWVQGQATWTQASNSVAWTMPGGDFDPVPLAELVADPSTVTVGQVLEFAETPALRRALLEVLDTSGLLQLVLVVDGEETLSNRVFHFHPRGTVGLEPALVLPSGALAGKAPRNPLRVRLHGVVNNAAAWSEDTLTWNTAPARADAISSPGPGAVPLAELTLDTATLSAGGNVTFADPRIAQFLNWAAGRRGDLYDTGQAADLDRRVTFILTALDGGEFFAGVKFRDRESGAGPVLLFDTGAVTPAAATTLENDRYRVVLQEDLSLAVTDKRDGATARFEAAFEVVSQSANPGFSRHSYDVSPTPLSLATWNTNFNYSAAPGERLTLRPVAARARDGALSWSYAPGTAAFAFRAELDLPAGTAFPRLRWTLTPGATRYFGVAFQPVAAVPNSTVDAFYLPCVWNGRRFPDNQYLIDETRATLPAAFRESGGVVSGVAADAFEVPQRVSTFVNSLFGLIANDATAAASRPAFAAPIYGSVGSRTDGLQSYAARLIVGGAGLDQAFRDVATGVFGFHDYRENLPAGSLNTALDNLVDFILNTSGQNYSYWRANEKANEYVNDNPDYVRFQSAAAALGLAMVRDDAGLYEERARPAMEYFLSRRGSMLKFTGYDPAYGMGGPVAAYYGTDFYALFGLTGGRTWGFLPLAHEARVVSGSTTLLGDIITPGQSLARGEAYDRVFDTLLSLIEAYRATGVPEYLADARWLTDEYVRHRYDSGPPLDFRDAKSSFWSQLGGRWDVLLEMEELTGDPRYAAAAARAMNEFARHVNFGPAVGDFTVDGLGVPVKAAAVSEVGLTCEATATSVSHRGIFMSAYASAAFLRAARLHADPFFKAVGRAGIVGRWMNYPGYTIRNNYNSVLLRSDYPLRWYATYANTAHMNHPLPLAGMAIDFLMADTELRSAAAVKFPHHYTDSRGYFRGRLYGGEPGVFYGDTEVWPWLPRALVSFAGPDAAQLNYVAGHGNGRLYLAFSNQAKRAVEVTVTVDPARVTLTPGARLRVWRDNVAQPDTTFVNGVTTISVPADGFVAWAIDGATPALGLQSDYIARTGAPLGEGSYQTQTASFGRVVGVVLSLSPTRQNAYVYTDADPTKLASARLRYRVDGGAEQTLTKAVFPFEFSVTLPAGTRSFSYVVEGTPAAGGSATVSEQRTLQVDIAPVITAAPAAQTVYAGRAVTLSVTVQGEGPFTYQWRRNGVAIPGATAATLELAGAPGEAGSYDVIVGNGAGTVTSPAALVTVQLGDLLAYALGGTGDAAPVGPLMALDAASGRLALSFHRARAEVDYAVQASGDLISWTELARNPGVVGQTVTVEDSVALTAAARRFLRLQVELP